MMKKIQLLIYAIVFIGFVIGFAQGGFNSYEKASLRCADYYGMGYSAYNKHLYWEENNQCCKYELINNSIMEYCKDGR